MLVITLSTSESGISQQVTVYQQDAELGLLSVLSPTAGRGIAVYILIPHQ